ncbi:hypothetical protein CYMTET_24239 [Cymbomonas tetramitiformis]|uniref:Uncharacterized protein n=1 Tax=Cymbomonas tetramitiformis TaxID=36881 RepID=A0AAE0FWA4_9CHLO|nr:hypothetical protein CYMTET_24239 [Cymbomonas tetramitiformis]
MGCLMQQKSILNLDSSSLHEFEEFKGMQEDLSEVLGKVTGVLSLFLGYLQVMGQLGNIFPHDILPDELLTFANQLFVFNLDISAMLNTRCLTYHFMPAVSSISPYWTSLLQAIATPWAIVSICFLLHRAYLICYASQHNKLKAAGLASSQTSSIYQFASVAAFFLILMHPSVSTTIMQLFNCEDYYYDEPERQEWLNPASNIECGTPEYHIAVGFCSVTILIYLIGLPLGIFVYMYQARGYRRCSVDRAACTEAALRRMYSIHSGKCLASSSLGVTESISSIDATEIIAEGNCDGVQMIDVYIAHKHIGVDMDETMDGTTHDAPDLDNNGSPYEIQSCPNATDIVVKVNLSVITMGDEPTNPELQINHEHEHDDDTADLRSVPSTAQLEQDGQSSQVYLNEKVSVGDGGSRTWVPITWMDSEPVQQVLGKVFLDPFEDTYYYWQCYEIMRRLLQTGVVVLVRWQLGTEQGVAYALLISTVALSLHLYFRPYAEDEEDLLMIAVLSNQALVQFGIVVNVLNSQTVPIIGIVLIGSQAAVILYTCKLLYPNIQILLSRVIAISKKVKRNNDGDDDTDNNKIVSNIDSNFNSYTV